MIYICSRKHFTDNLNYIAYIAIEEQGRLIARVNATHLRTKSNMTPMMMPHSTKAPIVAPTMIRTWVLSSSPT